MRTQTVVAGAFLVVAAAVSVGGWGGPVADAPGPRLGLLVAAGLAWAAALAGCERWARSRAALGWILAGAVVLRVLALWGSPGTSDDVHRYVFEGALVLGGDSPYAAAPADPERAPERARWPELYAALNHPEVSAAYPPGTQAVCALGVLAAGGRVGLDEPGGHARAVRALRVGFALADLAVVLPLALLLRARGRPPALLVAWAWCPLVVLEAGGAAHFDVVGVLLLFAALAAGARGRWGAAALALAGGALVKWLPLVAAPFVGRDARRPVAVPALTAAAVAAGLASVLLFDGGAHGAFRGLGEYAFRWEAFSLAFRWIERPLRGHFPLDEGWDDARRVARALVLVVFAAVALVLWLRRFDAVRATGVLVAAFVVLTPTLHPWYLAWLVPFLALYRSPAFLWLVAVAPVAYWPLARWQREEVWVEPGWSWPLVAVPFALLLAAELVALRRRRRPEEGV